MESIKGKNILVIGATGGIGTMLVKMLKSSGASLFITGRNQDKLNALCNDNNIHPSSSLCIDLATPQAMELLHEHYFKSFDTIDVLINVSGLGIIKNMDQLSEDDFMKVLQVNLITPFGIIKRFLPHMKEKGRGLMVHVPGILGKVPMAGAAAYSASKYGLVGMLQSIREIGRAHV